MWGIFDIFPTTKQASLSFRIPSKAKQDEVSQKSGREIGKQFSNHRGSWVHLFWIEMVSLMASQPTPP